MKELYKRLTIDFVERNVYGAWVIKANLLVNKTSIWY